MANAAMNSLSPLPHPSSREKGENETGDIFNPEDVLRWALDVAEKTGENHSSMLQDLERKRPTEKDSILIRLVERGREHGIPTPLIESIYILLSIREGETTG